MGASSFNEMELDAIGEIMNISLGASATAVSTMLGTLVNITTPVVSVLTSTNAHEPPSGCLELNKCSYLLKQALSSLTLLTL